MEGKIKTVPVGLPENSYVITVGRGLLSKVGEYFDLDRRVFILTDSGVPAEYSKAVASACRYAVIMTVKAGEGSKSFDCYFDVLKRMTKAELGRGDCVVAVGGGVVGDLGGFAASTYMRGIDHYNVPTTLLSQVDSSVGGKTGIDFLGYKNIVGTFRQPKGVLIDPDVLATLDERQFRAGSAEIVKMFATFDSDAFCCLEENGLSDLEKIIVRAVEIKRDVVEKDERETGLRRVLNFGHTVGHAIEAQNNGGDGDLLHGECVALGMLCMSGGEAKDRLRSLLQKIGLPTEWSGDIDGIVRAAAHDKKGNGEGINVISVSGIGSFETGIMTAEEIAETVKGEFLG